MQIIPEKFYGDWDVHCEIFFQNNPANFILSLSLSLSLIRSFLTIYDSNKFTL